MLRLPPVRSVANQNPSSSSAVTEAARLGAAATCAGGPLLPSLTYAQSRPKNNSAFWTLWPSAFPWTRLLACCTSARPRSATRSKKPTSPRSRDDGLLNPKRDAVEIDELCISWRRNQWLWTAVSRYTGQVRAFVIGDRRWDWIEHLWARLPNAWRYRLVYTDGYGAYSAFFSAWQHRVCDKFDGGTATVEGVNNSLRHRCGWLVRRSSARARDMSLLQRRLALGVAAHNRDADKRIRGRQRRRASMRSIR